MSQVLMGINMENDIVYSNDITYPSFKKIKGKLINLSYSNSQIYGIDSSQNIYYCNGSKPQEASSKLVLMVIKISLLVLIQKVKYFIPLIQCI